MRVALLSAFLGCGLLPTAPAAAQDTELLKSRILTAVRQSSLVSPTLGSYRLEGTITVFDGAGHNPQRGYFQIMRNRARVKIAVTFADATSTMLVNGPETYTFERGALPYYAPSLLRVIQTPQTFTAFGTDSPVQPKNLTGNVAVDCLSVVAPTNSVVRGPKVPIHEVCLDHDADDLHVVVDDDLEFIREDIFSFGGQRPARHIHLRLGGIVVGDAEITRLESESFNESAFAPTSDLKLAEKPPTRLSGAVMAGRMIYHENPKYPGAARMAHIQGIVVLHAIIGTDGHITNLSVISSPDKLLSEASLKTVNKWTYEPYLLDGKPTAVDTTITVNFAMGK